MGYLQLKVLLFLALQICREQGHEVKTCIVVQHLPTVKYPGENSSENNPNKQVIFKTYILNLP